MEVTTRKLTRAQLAEFLPNHRAIVAFETTQDDVTGMGDAFSTAQFITLSQDDNLGSERVLTGSDNISITDLGPMQPVILDLTDTGVVDGGYGSASKTVSFTVDVYGRLSLAAEYDLNTDNITEGGTNLFFTEARARTSVAGSSTITYDVVTGIFTLTAANVETALGYTPLDEAGGTLTGPLLSTQLQASASYANDAAASAGGVAIGEFYRNGSVVQIRIT